MFIGVSALPKMGGPMLRLWISGAETDWPGTRGGPSLLRVPALKLSCQSKVWTTPHRPGRVGSNRPYAAVLGESHSPFTDVF